MRAALLAVAVLFAGFNAGVAAPDMSGKGPYWKVRGCDHGHRSPVAGKRATRIMRSIDPLTKQRHRRVWHYVVCTLERPGHLKMRVRYRELAEWRRVHKGWIRERREWAYYRAHPMPSCTWVGESGGSYTARNPNSTAGGKFQMLDSTFHAFGGPDYPGQTHDAALAPPLVQERIARRVLAGQGIGAWVLC